MTDINDASRRSLLLGGLGVAAAAATLASGSARAADAMPMTAGTRTATHVTMKDGTLIYYKDWGTGPVLLFSHGWPLSADAWDGQMMFFAQQGFRCVAFDRRGHGRSSQPFNGNDMDTFADDIATLIETLDLHDVTIVGHSMGGGDVSRYVGRHGVDRLKHVAIVSGVPPTMLKTAANPGGLPISAFDGIRAGLLAGRSQFFQTLTTPFFGANRPGNKVTKGMRDDFWRQGMMGGLIGEYDCVKAFSETVFTEDLKKITVPVLILHGDDDQIVPIQDAAILSAKLVPNGKLVVVKGGSHALPITDKDVVNAALLALVRS